MLKSAIKEGMTVYSSDGEKLGKVIGLEADSFIVEKGLFFKKDYLCRYSDVQSLRGDDELLLSLAAGDFEEAKESLETRGVASGKPAAGTSGVTQQTTIPVMEEELSAEKHAREAGRVEVHKDVKTEKKTVTVPVTKEEIHVERVPGSQAAPPSSATFKEGDVSIPVYEEEIEIKKRPVIREEVRVSKTSHEEHRAASADTRREEVSVDSEGKVEKLDDRSGPHRKT